VIAVVGIDRYANWPRLDNAVSDARGLMALFRKLGFQPAAAPLFDDAATAEAMRGMVADELTRLANNDNLVVFFAGHGYSRETRIGDATVKTGYIIPANGAPTGGAAASWIRLDSWLSDIARLPARHILVILDACHSGIALGALVKWRDIASSERPIDELSGRVSRRIITSALDDQRAMDGGPYPQHSLFTGCLIEGLRGGLARDGQRFTTGTELGLYVRKRVQSFPDSKQTPDFGALELDDRGEMIIPILLARPTHEQTLAAERTSSSGAVPPIASPHAATTMPGVSSPELTEPRRLRGARRLLGIVIIIVMGSGIAVLAMTLHPDRGASSGPSQAPSAPERPSLPSTPVRDPAMTTGRDVRPVSPSSAKSGPAVAGPATVNPFIDTGHGVALQSHQVTRSEYARYLASLDDSARASAIPRFDWNDTRSDEPVAWVTFGQALRYCAAVGAHLPTVKEWKRASGGLWGLDPAGTGVRGPLREWTSTVDTGTNLAWVAGALATDPFQGLRIRIAKPAEELRHEPWVPSHDAVSNLKVGIRCAQ
jgi:hypothetical protein